MKSDLPERGGYLYRARSILVLIPFRLRLCPPRVGTCTEAELVPLCPRCLSEPWQEFLWMCGFIHFIPNKQTRPQSKEPPVFIVAESSHYPESFSLLFPLFPCSSPGVSVFITIPTVRIFYVWVWSRVFSLHSIRGKMLRCTEKKLLRENKFSEEVFISSSLLKNPIAIFHI